MAVVKAPFFSVEARGDFCGVLTYRRGRGQAHVYGHHEPVVPNTASQVKQQASFASAISAWHALPSASRIWWVVRAQGMRLSGYHFFVQNYLLGLIQ